MTHTQYTADDLVLCESADGWSLHAPGSSDEDIATGDAPYILDGEGSPTEDDYRQAFALWLARCAQDQFLHGLATTEAFAFDWTHGPYGDHCVVADCETDLDKLDVNMRTAAEDYIAAVRAAQEKAAEAMERARNCYREGDLDGTLSAMRDAASAEREFGDDPTYRLLVGYVVDLIHTRDAA